LDLLPETLPPEEDLIKRERRVKSPEKKIAGRAGNISPQRRDNKQPVILYSPKKFYE
jgi:hypothetical protein